MIMMEETIFSGLRENAIYTTVTFLGNLEFLTILLKLEKQLTRIN